MHYLSDPALWIPALAVFLAGLCVGSFLNVCIYRLPAEESIVRPRSRCPHCRNGIRWFDNVPVLSFLLLRGRCRDCGQTISWRYPLVELLTGVLFLAVFLKFRGAFASDFPVVLLWAFAALLVAVAFIDIDHFIIPDELSFTGLPLGVLFHVLAPEYSGLSSRLLAGCYSVASAVFCAGLLYAVGWAGTRVFRKEALGFGDVKLMAVLGAFLGVNGALLALFLSAFSGTLVSLAFIALGRVKLRDHIPYGPYLVLGGLVALLFGREIILWYIGLVRG